jgi:hypothetical protein
VDVGDDRLFYEDDCRAGDVVVYDGRSMHGLATSIRPSRSTSCTSAAARSRCLTVSPAHAWR